MRATIDWISICLPYKSIVSTNFNTEKLEIPDGIRDEFPQLTDWLHSYPDWTSSGGNRIFNRSIRSKLGGFSIFWNDNKPFSLIEITGTGCANLREIKKVGAFAYNHFEYLTRLDVCSDFKTNIRPSEFAAARDGKRFNSYADIKSTTGETYYVGSRNSERFCRVYRYNPPHPRHNLLRVEFQLKGEQAKQFAAGIRGNRMEELYKMLLSTFTFNHPLLENYTSQGKIRSSPRASAGGKTERWLFSQVLPAIKKLVDAGETETLDIFLKKAYDYHNAYLIQKENNDGTQDLRSNPDLLA